MDLLKDRNLQKVHHKKEKYHLSQKGGFSFLKFPISFFSSTFSLIKFANFDKCTAIGFILGQFDDNSIEIVLAYGGRSLNKFERNYSISERKCLAIIEGIKTYHVYLADKTFTVFTDHSALMWLQSVKHDTGRLARWSILLQGYNFNVVHKMGMKNGVADALCRRTYPDQPKNAPDPEDLIPSTNVSALTTNEEHNQVTFFYKNNTFQGTVLEKPFLCPFSSVDSVGQLQSQYQPVISEQ